MTMLSEPFAPMFELSRELDRYFNRNGMTRAFAPAADVVVADDAVDVFMDVPGFTGDDLEIELVHDTLTVRGQRDYPYSNGSGDGRVWQRLERGFGKFERVLRVPEGLDPDAIMANMDAGVLTLHIPKPETKKPRRIQIGTGASPEIDTKEDQRELAGATG